MKQNQILRPPRPTTVFNKEMPGLSELRDCTNRQQREAIAKCLCEAAATCRQKGFFNWEHRNKPWTAVYWRICSVYMKHFAAAVRKL